MTFEEHTVAALNAVEDIMSKSRVRIAGHVTRIDDGVLTAKMVEGEMAKCQIWFDDQGLIYCRDCAKDAKAGGARLRQSQIGDGLIECAGCRRVIKNEADLWR